MASNGGSLLEVLGYAAGCLLTVVIAVFIYLVISIERTHREYAHLTIPKYTSFLLGHAKDIGQRCNKPGEKDPKKITFNALSNEWLDEYGDTIAVFLLHKCYVVTRDPQIIKHVLAQADQRLFPKADLGNLQHLFGKRFLGEGMVSASDTNAWYHRRKAMDPAFHRKQMMNAPSHINMSADGMIDALQIHADSGETVELIPILHRATLDANLRVAFSVDLDHISTDFHHTVMEAVRISFTALQHLLVSVLPESWRQYNPMLWSLRLETRKALTALRQVGERVVQERMDMIKNGDHAPEDILTTIVQYAAKYPDEYPYEVLVDDFNTLIVAGMETSANSMASLFMELGRQPEIWQRLTEEIDEVIGKKHEITIDDVSKLTYLGQVIKETLRLYGPVQGLVRRAVNETVIDGTKLPKDAKILIDIYSANRNPTLVENPSEFNPDRYSALNEHKVPIYSFVTFSLGPRNCIGQTFAQLEMKIMVAKFIQQFTYKLDEKETFALISKATMFPMSGVKCTLRSRTEEAV